MQDTLESQQYLHFKIEGSSPKQLHLQRGMCHALRKQRYLQSGTCAPKAPFQRYSSQGAPCGDTPGSEQIGKKTTRDPRILFGVPLPRHAFGVHLSCLWHLKAGRIFTRRASEGALSKALLKGCFRRPPPKAHFRRLPPKARFSKASFFKALLPRHAWRRDPKDWYR